jgi:hypothetical protein
VVETMYWYEIPDEGYQLTLGPWSIAPAPPTWREFFLGGLVRYHSWSARQGL